jgi:hypothetical protein
MKKLAAKKVRDDERGRIAFPHLRDYINAVKPNYQWAVHHEVQCEVLNDVIHDKLDRAMISMPPRHGKSEQVSRQFPGAYLIEHPTRWGGTVSYGFELAGGLSRDARDNYLRAGGKLNPGAQKISHWETWLGGGWWSAGVEGSIIGKGANVAIIDDPFKSELEASKLEVREKVYNFYKNTLYNRLEAPGALVLMFTRWHEDDLQGRLVQEESFLPTPERWVIVRFEAIKTDEVFIVPESCRAVVDKRHPGEALWPEKYPLPALERIRDQMGGADGFDWLSLYQQSPRAKEGALFKESWFEIVNDLPTDCIFCRGWDLAGTEDGGDWTAGGLIGFSPGADCFFIADMKRFRHSPGRRDRRIRYSVGIDHDKYGYVIQDFEQEPASAGKNQMIQMKRLLSGFHVVGSTKPTTNEIYLEPLRAQAEIGRIKMLRGDWNQDCLRELTSFPKGRHDDQCVAIARAFFQLSDYEGLQIAYVGMLPEQEPAQ